MRRSRWWDMKSSNGWPQHKIASKYHATPEEHELLFRNIKNVVPLPHIIGRIHKLAKEINEAIDGKRAGLLWSGGKDSQVVRWFTEKLDVHFGMLVRAHPLLEFNSVGVWLDENTPKYIDVVQSPLTLQYVLDHNLPLHSWPSDLDRRVWEEPKWKLQREWTRDNNIEILLTGRRNMDGNYCGKNGRYMSKYGYEMYHPIYDWDTEELYAMIQYFDILLPPCYYWPRGFTLTLSTWLDTGCENETEMCELIFENDPSTLYKIAPFIPKVQEFLNGIVTSR